MLETIYYKFLKKVYQHKRFRFFEGAFNINIFGIRNAKRIIDTFNDIIGVAYMDDNQNPRVFWCYGTCDPGLPWVTTPMDQTLGTAAIVPGQYLKVWKLGFFRAERALLQIRPFTCFRDNNRDQIFDYNPTRTTTGIYGIHLHSHYQSSDIADRVGKSSAGCIVPRSKSDMDKIIYLCIKQKEKYGIDEYTFTLFDESELLEVI